MYIWIIPSISCSKSFFGNYSLKLLQIGNTHYHNHNTLLENSPRDPRLLTFLLVFSFPTEANIGYNNTLTQFPGYPQGDPL